MYIDKQFYEAWFDGSTSPHKQRSGIGGVIISPDNKIIEKYSMEIPYVKDSRMVEYIALIKLVEKLQQHGIKNVEIKTDFKDLCDSINQRKSIRFNKLMPGKKATKLHEQAINSLKNLNYYMIKWVSRKQNREADQLSKRYKNKINDGTVSDKE